MTWSVWRKRRREETYLIEQHGANLLAYIMGKTGDRIVSEDIAQEVWIRFFTNKEKVLNVRSFLFTVAKRQVIDYYRTKKQKTDLNDLENTVGFSKNGTDQYLLEEEHLAKLKNIFKEGEFLILKLTIEGYSDEEIGHKLGKSKKTIANQKSQLKSKIKMLGNE